MVVEPSLFLVIVVFIILVSLWLSATKSSLRVPSSDVKLLKLTNERYRKILRFLLGLFKRGSVPTLQNT
jgi:hypothetical protein